jgi:hypothetical protein
MPVKSAVYVAFRWWTWQNTNEAVRQIIGGVYVCHTKWFQESARVQDVPIRFSTQISFLNL